jgi:pyruvate-formate lyase-activating enzyme
LENQDGITLSGGDPLFQIKAAKEIAKHSKAKGLNIWCYTRLYF